MKKSSPLYYLLFFIGVTFIVSSLSAKTVPTYHNPASVAATDATVVSISPSGTSIVANGSAIGMTGIVQSNGQSTTTSAITVTRKIPGTSYTSTRTVSAGLDSGATATVVFDNFSSWISGTTYTIRDSVFISGDQDHSNDTLSVSFTPNAPKQILIYYEDAESRDSLTAHLDALGLYNLYDKVSSLPSISLTNWQNIFVLFHATGSWDNVLRDSLKTFLDKAGPLNNKSLGIFGDDIAYQNDPLRNSAAAVADTVFFRKYLRSQYIEDDWLTSIPEAGNKFKGYGNFSFITKDTLDADPFPDFVKPVNGGTAALIPFSTNTGDTAVAVYYTGSNYRMFYGTNVYSYYKSINGSRQTTSAIINYLLASFVWTGGAGTTDWNTPSNWNTGIVPGITANVTIPLTSLQPVISTASSCSNLTIASGATLNLSGASLDVYGTFTNDGTVISNGANAINLTGTAIQNITGTGLISNLTINNGNGASIAARTGNVQSLTGTLSVTSGIINTNGNFVLKSTAAATARIAAVPTGAVTGNVTVERFIPSNNRKAYTMVSAPVNSPTIYNAWQESGGATIGYGTQITGGTGTSSANGFDATSASGSASIFIYNDANASGSKWVSLTNTNATSLGTGKGFLLYVRGDRSEPRYTTFNSSNTTLRATGSIVTGPVTLSAGITTGAGKFSLIANPYPSPVLWTSPGITKTNLTSSFYTYDSNLGVFVSSNGSVVSPSASKQQPAYIQSGQGFFIQNDASGNPPSITFTEGAKAATSTSVNNTVFGNDAAIKPRININVYRTENTLADGVVVLFDNSFNKNIDHEDVEKFSNFNETFSLVRNNKWLGIEGRPMVAAKDTLFFALSKFEKKIYTLNIEGSNFNSMTNAMLEDRFINSKQVINLEGNTIYKFQVTDDAASFAANRFIITFGNTSAPITDNADNKLFIKLSPNPVKDKLEIRFKLLISNGSFINIVNSLGQITKTVYAGIGTGYVTLNVSDLAAGTYTVQLFTGGTVVATGKIVKR